MKILFIVAINTVREGLRKKFPALLLFACLIILGMSLCFAQLSLDDKGRLTVDFGLAGIQILLDLVAVFFSASFIGGDLDKKLWMILTRPVRPMLFFLGRWLGLAFLLCLSLLAFSTLLVVFFLFLKIPLQLTLLYALLGFLQESLFLLACVLFFSSYVNHFLTMFYCLSIFIIGHFLESVLYFSQKTEGAFSWLLTVLSKLFPNLERINYKSAVVYQDSIAFSEFALSSLYMFLWTGLILSLGLFIMEKREYG